MKYIFLLLTPFLFLSACKHKTGSGNITTQTRDAGSFRSVKVSAGIEVELKNGPFQVTVEADDNVIGDVQTTIEDGVLRVKLRENTNYNDTHIKVFVSAPEISGIEASSGSSINTTGQIKSSTKMKVEASSGASIHASLDAPEINIEASSGAEMELNGRTRSIEAEGSSSGNIKAFDLLSETVKAETSSGASLEVHASVSIDAEANSGGSIVYAGNPTAKTKENSGGSVRKQ